MSTTSLKSLMNAMVRRLEFAHLEDIGPIPEEKHWPLIGIYIQIDSVLAALYKEYCEAKDMLGNMMVKGGSDDPMTEIIWDMHDSARAAVETRLIELRDDKGTTERVRQLESLRNLPKSEYAKTTPSPAHDVDNAIVFLLMASMAMKSQARRTGKDFARRDFVRAS